VPERERFTLEEIVEIFRSYVERSEPSFCDWVPVKVSE
jgi:hypothetical protein